MRYVFCFFLVLCCFSCNKKSIDYTCDYVAMADSYPRGVKSLEDERQIYCVTRTICCILKFHNIGQDSIFLPFDKTGSFIYKSSFYIKCNDKVSQCPARFWGYQTNTHVVAPGDSVRIGVFIYPKSLGELNMKEDIDIQNLSKMVRVFYKYNPLDSTLNHLKTPMLEIKRDSVITLMYGE